MFLFFSLYTIYSSTNIVHILDCCSSVVSHTVSMCILCLNNPIEHSECFPFHVALELDSLFLKFGNILWIVFNSCCKFIRVKILILMHNIPRVIYLLLHLFRFCFCCYCMKDSSTVSLNICYFSFGLSKISFAHPDFHFYATVHHIHNRQDLPFL